MTKERRFEELRAAMMAFSRDRYQNSELLNEMFALQQEFDDLTFTDLLQTLVQFCNGKEN